MIDPLAPIIWATLTMFLLFGGYATKRLVNDNWMIMHDWPSSAHPSEVLVQVLALAIVSTILLVVGYYGMEQRSDALATALPQFPRGWSTRRAWIVVSIFVLIGIVSYLSLQPAIGEGPRSELASGDTMLAFIGVNLLNAATAIALADIANRNFDWDGRVPTLQGRWLLKIPAGGIILVMTVALLATLGGRARALSSLVVLFFLFHYFVRRFRLWEAAIPWIAVNVVPGWIAALAFSLLSLDRAAFFETLISPWFLRSEKGNQLTNVLTLFAGMPDEPGLLYGETILAGFVSPLPIQPWREGYTVFNEAFRDGQAGFGFPYTLMGEFYLNFHIPGVIVGMLLLGAFIRLFYGWAIEHGTVASIVIFAVISNQFTLGSILSTAIPQLGLKLLPLGFALFYISHGGTTESEATTQGPRFTDETSDID